MKSGPGAAARYFFLAQNQKFKKIKKFKKTKKVFSS
jgi:hypothetical protein